MLDVHQIVRRARRLRALNMFITEQLDVFEAQAAQLLDAQYKRLKRHKQHRNHPIDNNTSSRMVFPIAVKDAFSTSGIRTTCGSKMLADYVPPFTATIVKRLEQAGGVIVGKTNMDEFSMGTSTSRSYFGAAKNPWTWVADPDCDLNADWLLPGGSSGGSAIAVACNVAKIISVVSSSQNLSSCACLSVIVGVLVHTTAVGRPKLGETDYPNGVASDTGGSTRNPSAFCGVVGLCPSYGLLSRWGLVPLVNSLDTPALITQNVDDVAWALDLTAGRDPKDATSIERPARSFQDYPKDIRALTIGIPQEYHSGDLSSSVLSAWKDVADWLTDEAGCTVVPIVQFSFDGVRYGHRAEGAYTSVHELYAASRSEAFNEVVRRRILAGNYFLLREHYDQYYRHAARVRRLIANDFTRVFHHSHPNVDVLLTPVTADAPPFWSELSTSKDGGYERERQDDFFTQPANMAGLPSITIPIRRCTNQSRPIGLQLIGDRLSEHKLLAVAKWIEDRAQFEALDVDFLLENIE